MRWCPRAQGSVRPVAVHGLLSLGSSSADCPIPCLHYYRASLLAYRHVCTGSLRWLYISLLWNCCPLLCEESRELETEE